MTEVVFPHNLLKKEPKEALFSDIWEKWGRHIWEKGVLRILFPLGVKRSHRQATAASPERDTAA